MYSLIGNREKAELDIFYFEQKPVLVNFDTMEVINFMKFAPNCVWQKN